MRDDESELKYKLKLSHRILCKTGSMGDITGHVITRGPGGRDMIVRCRNDRDIGPAFVEESAFFRFDLDGNPVEDLREYIPPPERYIGAEVFKTRDDVNTVVHAHPPGQILCGITAVEIRPIVGCANWGGMLLALDGVPVFPRAILVASPELGQAMVAVMGHRNVVLLKGHGNVVAGRSIEEATVRAIQIENIARICWKVAAAGMHASDVSEEDIQEFKTPTQKAAQANSEDAIVRKMWGHYERALLEDLHLYVEMGVAH
jgi:3,4-dihydroxyphthalate decarboxylase